MMLSVSGGLKGDTAAVAIYRISRGGRVEAMRPIPLVSFGQAPHTFLHVGGVKKRVSGEVLTHKTPTSSY